MTISITVDTKSVIDALAPFSDDVRNQVAAVAVNKTLAKAKAEMKRQILAVYNLKSTEVGAALYTSSVSRKNNKYTAELYPGTIGGAGRAMNVVHFLNGTSKGELTFIFKRAGATKIINAQPSGESKPFIGNAGRTVFRRQGKGRLPIESVQVIDVPQMFNTKVINQAVLDKASADLLVEADRALAYVLSKMGATA